MGKRGLIADVIRVSGSGRVATVPTAAGGQLGTRFDWGGAATVLCRFLTYVPEARTVLLGHVA